MDSGNIAWLLTAASLVLLMTPGLALFYGGMSRRKSVLNMMMMSFGAMAVVAVAWVLVGNAVSVGETVGGWFGNPGSDFLLLNSYPAGVGDGEGLISVGFGATFAIITTALISGSIADRAKFKIGRASCR